jgi:PAS domain S-box-containing protein
MEAAMSKVPEGSSRVLVVDDNPAKRYSIARLLRAAGFVVSEAGSGHEALEVAAEGPDAIVLDVNLPDIDGYEVCRKLREREATVRTPIIHLSATFTESGDKVYGLESGADGYLTHPVEPPVLVATVRAFIRARHAEEAMRRSEEKYRTIFDKAMNGIILFDEQRNVIEANPAMERLLGLPPGESLVGQNMLRFRSDEAAASSEARYAEMLRRGGWNGTVKLLRADGSEVFVEGTISRHSLPGLWIGLFSDITGRVAAEADRERLHSSEREARTEAERANRLKDDFLATISHELRAPLQAIVGWAQLLRARPPTEASEYRAGIEAIDRNARVQAQLISDLLDVSRITSGKLRLHRQDVDLAQVVDNAIETMAAAAAARGVVLEKEIADPQLMVSADAGRLQQVLNNLLSNAIKFTPEGGHVRVRARLEESHVELSVHDEGQGIGPEFLPHIFDAFRQEEATGVRRHEGLGLGLSIVKRLVEMHGGSVRVESPGPGLGATFTVLLPTLAASRASAEAASPDSAISPPDVSVLRGLHVLLVDDDDDARALVRRLLDDYGVRSSEAASVDEALRRIAEATPDLLVSDISMPGQDGYMLLRQLRDSGLDGEHLPALALTAFARPEDRTRALSGGFQAHLGKPIDLESLLLVLVALARRRGD